MSWYDLLCLFKPMPCFETILATKHVENKVGGRSVHWETSWTLLHWSQERATEPQDLCRLSIHIIIVIVIFIIIIGSLPKGAELEWIGDLGVLLNKQGRFIKRFWVCVFYLFWCLCSSAVLFGSAAETGPWLGGAAVLGYPPGPLHSDTTFPQAL